MLSDGNILLEPMAFATAVILQTCTVGIPALSSSFTIAAPQRVLVPQVEVNRTASISCSLIYSAISSPILLLFAKEVIRPVVPK